MLIPASSLKAEVFWSLKVVSSHFSLISCLRLNDLFKAMFIDSKIVKSFQLSKIKCSYFINYRLSLYFKDVLLKSINSSEFFVLSYNESLHKVLQEDQMDVHFRFWDNDANEVSTRFYDSHFLKRANAKNLFECLQSSLNDVTSKNLLQLSMNGPNNNWKVLELLDDERKQNDYPTILNIGSCGLHVIHGVFKTGVEATDWGLNKILRTMWKLFDNSPARRDTHIESCQV